MKTIVMTGITSGFGAQWLYELDRENSVRFLILARNRAKFEKMILTKPLKNSTELIECDLLSLVSIDKAISQIKLLANKVDILINNAGLWSDSIYSESDDHIESTLAVNLIAPFVITGKLLPLMQKSEGARVVNTASFRHKDAKIVKSDIQLSKRFSAETAYCNSKLYSVLFTMALAKKCEGYDITVNCFDPGIVDTPMLKQGLQKVLSFLYPIVKRIARTPIKGAETGVYLALSGDVSEQTGQYYKDKKIAKISKMARDLSLQEWLWRTSEELSQFEYYDARNLRL